MSKIRRRQGYGGQAYRPRGRGGHKAQAGVSVAYNNNMVKD